MAYTEVSNALSDGINQYYIASSAFGTCSTAANTAAKTVNLGSSSVKVTKFVGMTIHVMFTNSNTAASPTLKVNGLSAIPIYRYGTTAPGITPETSWYAGEVVTLTLANNASTGNADAWIMNSSAKLPTIIEGGNATSTY